MKRFRSATLVVLFAACGGSNTTPSDGDTPALGDEPTAGDPLPVTSCAAIVTTECFSSYDCPDAQACRNVGALEPLPCCIDAPRGSTPAGQPCDATTGERECESSICIEGLCSTTCTSNDECPVGMKRCMPIAFSQSPDDWCFPQ